MGQEQGWMEKRRNEAGRAKRDVIGEIFYSRGISEIRYFDFEMENGGDGVLPGKIESVIGQCIMDDGKRKELSGLITDYACSKEIQGFREGFSIALRVFMQGLSGKDSL